MANITGINSSGATVEIKATGAGTTGDPHIPEHSVSNLNTLATVAAQTAAQTSLTSIDGKLSPLATAAAQTTAQTSLASIDGKLSPLATSAAQTAAQTSLTSIDGKLTPLATAAAQATAQASLSSIDTKLTALAVKASVTVVASQSVTVGGTSAVSAVWNGSTTRVILVSTTDCWVAFGATPSAVAAAAGAIFVPSSVYGYPITVTAGQKLAVIQAAIAGTLCILEAA